eukprot:gene5412-10828_t
MTKFPSNKSKKVVGKESTGSKKLVGHESTGFRKAVGHESTGSKKVVGHESTKKFNNSSQPVNKDVNTTLTKQQKRDLKRNDKAKSIQPVFSNTPKSESVYKRVVVRPPIFTSNLKLPKNRFVKPTDPYFDELISSSYEGFVLQSPDKFDKSFHDSFRTSLEGLESNAIYQFDMTQPAGLGTKLAKTFVTRCLVGEPGITYKYLGLRMFAIPWTEGQIGTTSESIEIGKLNKNLISRSKQLLQDLNRPKIGSCEYNLTLINRCFPKDEVKLKDEPLFKKEKCTVSWHADSSLEHYSSIAVYHCTGISTDSNNNHNNTNSSSHQNPSAVPDPWRIALRVAYDVEGPTAGKLKSAGDSEKNLGDGMAAAPPVSVPLPSEWSYFLLDDFNHHHQHSVLAADTHRFASTHRVSRTEGHSFQWIKARCCAVLQVE